MDDEDGLMITGAKKKNTLKDYDKNDLNTCIANFKKFVYNTTTEDLINKETLIDLCLNGEVDKYLMRPVIWKTFLNVWSINNKLEDWVHQASKQRTDYKNKLKNLTALKKFSGDPLGGSGDTGWNSFFEENELKKIINLDVMRTYQDKDLFQNTVIKEMLVNILFIWSKDNKDVSYKQGMNEILAVILFAIYPYYFKNDSKSSPEKISAYAKEDRELYSKEIYLYFHDSEELAGDLFTLFDAVMNKGVKDLYDNGTVKKKNIVNFKKFDLFQQQWTEEEDQNNQLPLQKRCFLIIKEKLKVIDEELYNHFIKIDLNCAIFLQRWLKCIFNREFHPRDVIVLWDAIIANDLVDSLNHAHESYSFMFIDFIAVAMINYIREDLLRKDQNDGFQRLFKYPPIESPLTLIKLANQIKELLFKKKRKKEQNNTNETKITKHENHNSPNSNNPLNNNNSNSIKGKTSLSSYLKSANDTNTNTHTNTNTKSDHTKNMSSISNGNIISTSTTSSPMIKNIVEKTRSSQSNVLNLNNKSTNSEEFSGTQIVTKLEDIYKKYKTIFDNEDASDFEAVIDALKNNLSD